MVECLADSTGKEARLACCVQGHQVRYRRDRDTPGCLGRDENTPFNNIEKICKRLKYVNPLENRSKKVCNTSEGLLEYFVPIFDEPITRSFEEIKNIAK
jgi:hypothetical protein